MAPPKPATPVTLPAKLPPTPTKDSLDDIRKRGVLRACIAPYAPWAIAGENDAWTSFSVNIARQLAEDLSVQVSFMPGRYGDLLQRVAEGECDLVPSGLAPTPDRALFVHFSRPTTTHDIAIVADKAAAAEWKGLADLDRSDIALGVVQDSVEASDAKRAFPKATLMPFPDHQELTAALQLGKLKALVAASPLPDILMKQAPDKLTLVARSPIAHRSEALAVRRGDLEFLAFLNDWIQARTDDGWLKARADQWFENLDWATDK